MYQNRSQDRNNNCLGYQVYKMTYSLEDLKLDLLSSFCDDEEDDEVSWCEQRMKNMKERKIQR